MSVNEQFNVSISKILTLYIESIMNYEIEFEKKVGKNLNNLSLEELKTISWELRDNAMTFFKSKAVGDVEEFENVLRD